MDFTPAEIVKSYTKLIKISEIEFSRKLAVINIKTSTNNLEKIAKEIIEYCKKVDSTENNLYSLVDNLENECYVVNINEETDNLVNDFFDTLKNY